MILITVKVVFQAEQAAKIKTSEIIYHSYINNSTSLCLLIKH